MTPPTPPMYRLAALAAALLLALGCGENTPPCQSDDDCRAGYRCDDSVYAGQCVQSVYVIRCGQELCQYGREQCVGGECREISDGGFGGRDMSIIIDRGVDPGADMSTPLDRGIVVRPDEGPDAAVGPEVPSVVITAPFDDSILFDPEVEVVGQIFRLEPDGVARLVIDGGEPGRMIEVDGSRRFRETVTLEPGTHTLEVIAEQAGLRGEASVTIRVDAFVEVQNGEFVRGRTPFRFVGLAMPDLLEVAVAVPDLLDVAFEQAREMGVEVIRTRAYDDRPEAATAIQIGPGDLSEVGLLALDRIIERAGAHGLKLVLSLGDGTDRYGGPGQYLRWAGYVVQVPSDRALFFGAGPMREQFKGYARSILTRVNGITDLPYRDDPTIMGWVILDGVDATGAYDDATGAGVSEFYADVIPLIEANAPRQLVATGDVGYDINAGPYGDAGDAMVQAGLGGLFDGSRQVGWQRNLRLPGVDFATLELDPTRLGLGLDVGAISNNGASWIRGHAIVSAIEGKPLMTTTRLSRDALSLADRRAAIRAWFDEVLSLELAGLVVGDFQAPGQMTANPAGWSWTVGTDAGDPGNTFTDTVIQFSNEILGR